MIEVVCNIKKAALHECLDLSRYPQYENELFDLFISLYENGNILYQNIPVKMKHYPPDYDKKTGFYHLICENYDHTADERDRKPNIRRCERIEWAKELIQHCASNCSKVMVWENTRRGKENILLYCPEYDYVVVLGKRNGYLLLTTAYPVDREQTKQSMYREYNEYNKNKQRTTD